MTASAIRYPCFIIWCFVICNADAEKYEAMIFNGQTHSLIYKPKNPNLLVNWSIWDLACPASDDQQRKFAKEYSFYDERALFMQTNYYEKTIHSSDSDDTNVCDEAIKLSMLIGETGMALEFGYEIYYKSSAISAIRESGYNDYLPLKFLLKYKSAWRDKNLCSIATNCFAINNVDELLLDNKQQMRFLWIPLFKLWYPIGHYEFRKIVYEIHRNNIDPSIPCDDYNMGQELFAFYEETSTGHPLYSKENQMTVLGGLELPPAETESACEPEYDCLMKWQLIPADQFQFGHSEHLSCSNLATIPIWKSTIEAVMRKLDLYLYTFSRVSKKPLRITAGITGTLQLKSTNKFWLWPWEINSYVYLNEKTKLRVPNIIYKMVRYQTNRCEGGLKFCWHGVVIVIHNGPYVAEKLEKDRVCKQDKSEELGWDDIKFIDGVESKFIYVCSISKETFSKIGLSFKTDVPVQDLSLLQFPYFDENKQTSWKDMKIEISQELDRLSESGEKLKLKGREIIERPPIDFDKFINSQVFTNVYGDESGDTEKK